MARNNNLVIDLNSILPPVQTKWHSPGCGFRLSNQKAGRHMTSDNIARNSTLYKLITPYF
jgi:hypothetical protein